ncbi:MAG: undecaprenyldiphospho-muramoylpentapeptide beta-N-acetylglucosaminyltransferase [Solobacterium sp.]|nr:undecaprenyldiphospho-muramoylpentapeptide beta-N-acetylglucosaminyltransferase [Solobacterium sp.]
MNLVMISAGGTGGHIYPALAVADLLKEEQIRTVFVGSSDRLEGQLIPEHGYEFVPIQIPSTSGSILGKVKYVLSMGREIASCRKLLKRYQPDACIGFGNYISVPLILAAKQLGIPTMISEQNSFAGKANVFLGRFADAVELAYEGSAKDFPSAKTRVLGNPRAQVIAQMNADESLISAYGLDNTKPFVAVMMGSLGSETMSKIIDEAYQDVTEYQVLIASGKHNNYQFHTDNANVIVREYISGADILKLCDLAVCRAGATTLAEIGAAGTPSILVPSPYVPNNHQYFNALELETHGAAVILEETALTASLLREVTDRLMNDAALRIRMSSHASEYAHPRAGSELISWLKELVHEG